MNMAVKKKKKAVKKVSPKRVVRAKKTSFFGVDRDFLIISGGGLLVIVLTAFLLF
jgi:hypothetical protein